MTICSLLVFRSFGLLAALNFIWINDRVRSQTQFSYLPLFSVTGLTITRINVMHFSGLRSEDGEKTKEMLTLGKK